MACRVLAEGGTLEVGEMARKESRAGGSKASRGRNQPDLACWQSCPVALGGTTQLFKHRE